MKKTTDKVIVPTTDEIIAMVLDSNVFGRSKNQRTFFEYLMRHDPDTAPSEYEIASVVFNRNDDFDPAIDSVVRIEKYRLRRNLERFNATSETLKIEIPPRSFIPVIEHIEAVEEEAEKEETISSSGRFTHLPLIIAMLALAAIITALFFGALHSSKHEENVPAADIKETFRQKISVATVNTSNDALTGNLLNQLVSQFRHDIFENNIVWLVAPGDSDYRMEFQSEKMTKSAENEVFILVYSNSGNLIYSKSYKISANQSNTSIADVSQKIYVDAFEMNGSVVRYHATNPDIDPRRQYLYQCALDSLTFTLEDVPNYLGTDYLTCLDPEKANIPNDVGFIYALRADIFSHIALGNIAADTLEIAIDDPIEEARKALKMANKYSYLKAYYFGLKVRVELLRNPIDHAELRLVIDDYYRLYPNDDITAYIIAEIESKYFGNWERAQALALQSIGDMTQEAHIAHIVLFNDAVLRGDWAKAEKQYRLTPKNTGISTLIPVAHLACQTNNQGLIREVQTLLAGHKITDWDAVVTYVNGRDYHKDYAAQLIDDQAIVSCGLF